MGELGLAIFGLGEDINHLDGGHLEVGQVERGDQLGERAAGLRAGLGQGLEIGPEAVMGDLPVALGVRRRRDAPCDAATMKWSRRQT